MMLFKLVLHMGDDVIDSDHGLLKPCANDAPLSSDTIPYERNRRYTVSKPLCLSRRHPLANLLTPTAISYSSV